MNTVTIFGNGKSLFSLFLMLVCAALVYGVLNNKNLPLISSTSGALVLLFVLGFAMCTTGGLAGKVDRDGFSWLNPFVIVTILLGIAAVYILFAGLTDRWLPFVTGARGAFILLTCVIGLKLVLSRLHAFLLS